VCVCVCLFARAHAILSTAKQRLETAFELDNDQWPHPLMFCVIFFRVKGAVCLGRSEKFYVFHSIHIHLLQSVS